jgi:hypothetical protein
MNRSQTHECENWAVAARFLFWEFLYKIFGIGSLQCISPGTRQTKVIFVLENRRKQPNHLLCQHTEDV